MRLLTLQIRNFKGLKELDLNPDGADINAFGANGLGKTTIADAYFWLLFGKNLSGAADFEIFPHGAPDGVEPSVYGKFLCDDGHQFSLRRTIKKNFVRKKGEAQAEFKGHTKGYYIDEIPKKASEYESYIESLGDIAMIFMLSDPDRFPGKIKWQDRRKLLLESFAKGMSEKDIILKHSELEVLLNHVGAMYTVQDVLDTAKSRRKKINDELKQLPGRIDECMRNRTAFEPAEKQVPIAKLAKDRLEAQQKIESIKSGLDVSGHKSLIALLETEIAEAKAAYAKQSAGGNDVLETQCMQLRKAVIQSKDRIHDKKSNIESWQRQIDAMQSERKELMQQFNTAKQQEFTGEECPTCHREYEGEMLEKHKETFNLSKAERLKSINSKYKELGGLIKDFEADVQQSRIELDVEDKRLPEIQRQLEELQNSIVTPAAFETTKEYADLVEKLEKAKARLRDTEIATAARVAKYQKILSDIDAQLDVARKAEMAKEIATQNEERIKELMAQEKKLGDELAKEDNLLIACEKFTQLQADDYEEEINRHFKFVKWKLFDRQINGGIAPACEATVKGIAYNDTLNTAAKLNAGLDIINAFTAVHGEAWPIFIDNAESVTKYLKTNGQVIKLFVSARDTKLRIEIKNREEKAA